MWAMKLTRVSANTWGERSASKMVGIHPDQDLGCLLDFRRKHLDELIRLGEERGRMLLATIPDLLKTGGNEGWLRPSSR